MKSFPSSLRTTRNWNVNGLLAELLPAGTLTETRKSALPPFQLQFAFKGALRTQDDGCNPGILLCVTVMLTAALEQPRDGGSDDCAHGGDERMSVAAALVERPLTTAFRRLCAVETEDRQCMGRADVIPVVRWRTRRRDAASDSRPASAPRAGSSGAQWSRLSVSLAWHRISMYLCRRM